MPRTAASSTYATQAVVLRHRDLGEKDRVITLLSPERGKLSAIAKGARQTKSKLAAVTQPFVLARFFLAHGRNFDIVTQTVIEDAFVHIATDLLKTAWATYLCELCDVLPENLPDEELFEAITLALGHLDKAGGRSEVELVGRWFETRFLSVLGYNPVIGRCVACGTKISIPSADAATLVAFSPARGGTLCGACGGADPQHLRVRVSALRWLHRLEKAVQPPTTEQFDLSPAAARDLRDCLRRSLLPRLDTRLKSLTFLEEVSMETAI